MGESMNRTKIDREELAYGTRTGSCWGSRRKATVIHHGRAGRLAVVTAGVPDTFFSIPAHDSRGVPGTIIANGDTGELEFFPTVRRIGR